MLGTLASVLRILRIASGGMVFVFCLVMGTVSVTIAADDSYIAGYAAAVLENEFNVPGAILQVQEGVVIVTADWVGKVDRQKVISTLRKIPGCRARGSPGRHPAPRRSGGASAGGSPAKTSQTRVKIPSSWSPRDAVPCIPPMAALFRRVPSNLIGCGADQYRLDQFR